MSTQLKKNLHLGNVTTYDSVEIEIDKRRVIDSLYMGLLRESDTLYQTSLDSTFNPTNQIELSKMRDHLLHTCHVNNKRSLRSCRRRSLAITTCPTHATGGARDDVFSYIEPYQYLRDHREYQDNYESANEQEMVGRKILEFAKNKWRFPFSPLFTFTDPNIPFTNIAILENSFISLAQEKIDRQSILHSLFLIGQKMNKYITANRLHIGFTETTLYDETAQDQVIKRHVISNYDMMEKRKRKQPLPGNFIDIVSITDVDIFFVITNHLLKEDSYNYMNKNVVEINDTDFDANDNPVIDFLKVFSRDINNFEIINNCYIYSSSKNFNDIMRQKNSTISRLVLKTIAILRQHVYMDFFLDNSINVYFKQTIETREPSNNGILELCFVNELLHGACPSVCYFQDFRTEFIVNSLLRRSVRTPSIPARHKINYWLFTEIIEEPINTNLNITVKRIPIFPTFNRYTSGRYQNQQSQRPVRLYTDLREMV